ncbi:serine/threonine-protein phosphatase 7 long form homolog isoform X4 [Fagus crenata]
MTYFRGGPRDKVGPSDDKGKAPMVDLDPPSTRDSDSDEGDHRVLFSPHRVGGELYAPLDLHISDTSLLKNLNRHPSAYVRVSMMRPSIGSGCSNRLTFDQISVDLLPPYRDFLVRLGFGPFLSIPSMHIRHSLIEALWERFFAETGTYHLPTLELAPTPLDWSALLGIRFGGLLVPQSTLLKVEINEILGMDALRAEYQDIYEGKGDKLKINLHALYKTIPWNANPDEFALRRFFLYFIGSCFLGQDKSTIQAHLVGAVRDSSKIDRDDPYHEGVHGNTFLRWDEDYFSWFQRVSIGHLLDERPMAGGRVYKGEAHEKRLVAGGRFYRGEAHEKWVKVMTFFHQLDEGNACTATYESHLGEDVNKGYARGLEDVESQDHREGHHLLPWILARLLLFHLGILQRKEGKASGVQIYNGNLYDWLHAGYSRDKILEWPLRIKIGIGIARGLA